MGLFEITSGCTVCKEALCSASLHHFAPMDSIAEEVCAQSESNPVWNQESSAVPQGSPQRTLMMPSIAAMFHQLSLLCRQRCACDCMTKHALPSMLQHNARTLTVLMLHSNYFTSHKMTFQLRFSFWPAKRIPRRCISLHKGQVLPPTVSYFSLFDSHAQSKRLEDPS